VVESEIGSSASGLVWMANFILRMAAVSGGVAVNTLTAFIILKCKKLRNSTNVFFAAFACDAALLFAVIGSADSYPWYSCANGERCVVTAFIRMMLTYVWIYTFAIIAFNRYILVCCSRILYARIFSVQRSCKWICLIWLTSAAISVPPLVGLGEYGFNAKFQQCLVNVDSDGGRLYMAYFFVMLGVIPSVAVSFFSCGTVLRHMFVDRRVRVDFGRPARASRRPDDTVSAKAEHRCAFAGCSDHWSHNAATCLPAADDRRSSRWRQKEYRATLHLMLISALFSIAVLPTVLVSAADSRESVSGLMYYALTTAEMSACGAIMIVYVRLNSALRKAYAGAFRCRYERS